MPTTFIYCLAEPHSGVIRYVGKSNNPAQRLRSHLKDKMSCHRTTWLAGLSRKGLRPMLVLLEKCPEETWEERERHWIKFLRENGADLVNNTDGGEGVTGHSPELRAKMSAAMKGRPAPNKGKHHTPETRARLSMLHRGKAMLPQTRAAIARANIGLKRSSETRAKMGATKIGKPLSSEHRSRIGNTLRGRKHPENCGHCKEILGNQYARKEG